MEKSSLDFWWSSLGVGGVSENAAACRVNDLGAAAVIFAQTHLVAGKNVGRCLHGCHDGPVHSMPCSDCMCKHTLTTPNTPSLPLFCPLLPGRSARVFPSAHIMCLSVCVCVCTCVRSCVSVRVCARTPHVCLCVLICDYVCDIVTPLEVPDQLDFRAASGYCSTAGDDEGPADNIEELLGPVNQRMDTDCDVDAGQGIGSPTPNLTIEIADYEVSCSFTRGFVSKSSFPLRDCDGGRP